MSTASPVRRPASTWLPFAIGGLLTLLAILALDWNFAALTGGENLAAASRRLGSFLAGFGAPDLSPEMLALGARLSLQTLATAVLGTALGALLGYGLALGASRAVMLGNDRAGGPQRLERAARRALLELFRLILDFLRGIPDFAWAGLILVFPGPGPVTGMLALALSVGGILGKIYGELWDGIAPARYQALAASGAGRMGTFLYGIQPQAAKAMLSYTLMRAECAVRNASVIGVVGGGGLGAELFDQFNYGHPGGVITLLGFLLVLTAGSDLVSGLLRRQLLGETVAAPALAGEAGFARARRRRGYALGATCAVLALLGVWQMDAVRTAVGELARLDLAWVQSYFARLAHPDFSARTLSEAASGAVVPLSLGWLGTVLGSLGAAALAYPMSVRFQLRSQAFSGEHPGAGTRAARGALLVAARGTALVLRSIPEVAWVLVLAAFFRIGVLPGMLALAAHSAGVLARVFTEAIDDVPERRLEAAFQGSRFGAFLYGALPQSLRSWKAYAMFQLEVNVRTGLVLGMIGVGGLGDLFDSSRAHWAPERMSTFALAMVLLTIGLDRLSRRLA